MKKTATFLFAASVAIALAACSGNSEEYSEEPAEEAEVADEAAMPEAAEEGEEVTFEGEASEDGPDGTGNPIGPGAESE